MKVMVTFSIRPGCVPDAVKRFLSGQVKEPQGLKLLGRWHKTDGSGGYALYELDNPASAYQLSAAWMDVLESHSSVVIEDAEAGPILAKLFT